jgi:hypothetical protein
MPTPKPLDQHPDRDGVTIRDKLVILGFVGANDPIEPSAVIHAALDIMLADRAIRKPTHPIRT